MKRPPVEGMPSPRPTCRRCGKPLAFHCDVALERLRQTPRRVFTRWNAYPSGANPLFCTLRCALDFAVLCVKAGYAVAPATRATIEEDGGVK